MKRRHLDVVVPCSTKQHKVRLNTKRLWASARCPKCKSSVDPTRLKRLLGLLVGLYRATGGTTLERVTVSGAWLYLAALVMLSLGLWRLGDHWGPMTVLLFGPRWVLLVPVLVLTLAAIRVRPYLLIPLAAAGTVAVGPLMGFRLGWRSWFDGDLDGTPLRVVSYNVAGGDDINISLPWMIEETRADIIGFQECGSPLGAAVRALPDVAWYTNVRDGTCLVSRYPIREARQLDRENIMVAGGAGMVIRYTIDLGGRELHLTNLHLDTPRAGLGPVREGSLSEGFGKLQTKSLTRDIESRQAREWVDAGAGAIVVLGDFNLPVESVIYRKHWGDMLNAFSHSGFGFGFTRFNGWIRARIDHVLVGAGVHVRDAFVGPDFGSDHRPMIADLIVPTYP